MKNTLHSLSWRPTHPSTPPPVHNIIHMPNSLGHFVMVELACRKWDPYILCFIGLKSQFRKYSV